MPIADEQYALEKLGRNKWEKIKAIARRYHWDVTEELYCSEIVALSRCKTTDELQRYVEDYHAFRDALGAELKPHLKTVKGGA